MQCQLPLKEGLFAMENSYTSYLSFEKFLAVAAKSALIEAGWPDWVELAVGWQHIEAVGPRSWIYLSQANGLRSDDVLEFSISVSRRGKTTAKFLGQHVAFAG